MKYLGSTKGAVIKESVVDASQTMTKLILTCSFLWFSCFIVALVLLVVGSDVLSVLFDVSGMDVVFDGV